MEDFDFVVLEFMRDYPMVAQYKQPAAGTYNSSTGEYTASESTIEVEALLMDLTLSSNGLSTRFGTLVVSGDKQLLVRPPNKTNPASNPLVVNTSTDRVVVNGIEYKIVTYKEVNPTGDDIILLDLYIRR